MTSFSKFEAFERVPGTKKKYRLTKSLIWEVFSKGSGVKLIIPEGRIFDISVPAGLEWAQNPHDRQLLPCAAIHDEVLNIGGDVVTASATFRRSARARGKSLFWSWVLFFSTLFWTAFKRQF